MAMDICPRAAWTYETIQDCWLRHNEHIPFEIQDREHCEQIKTWRAIFWSFFFGGGFPAWLCGFVAFVDFVAFVALPRFTMLYLFTYLSI